MLNTRVLHFIISDILSNTIFKISEIAEKTRISEDVIYKIAFGYDEDLSFKSAEKIIEFHRTVRPDFYSEIVNKIKNKMMKKI